MNLNLKKWYDSMFNFQPSLDNIHALAHSFTNSSQARREGLKFQDTVYEVVRADRFSVYAKKVSFRCSQIIIVYDFRVLNGIISGC